MEKTAAVEGPPPGPGLITVTCDHAGGGYFSGVDGGRKLAGVDQSRRPGHVIEADLCPGHKVAAVDGQGKGRTAGNG